MWNPVNSDDQTGQVAARMETTLGSASISVSQQQAPKKCAPVVAPKPKFNPYKHVGEPAFSDSAVDYPPPPPPAEESTGFSPPPGSFPSPPPMNSCDYQVRGPEKTLEERRSSLDAEIDSLTSILADLESSSPYKPRITQNSVSSAASSPSAPVTGYKRMVIPTQPPLTATKKSTPKPQAPGGVSSIPPSPASTVAKAQSHTGPQPVPASYATASTPSQPTFNVQVRSAQPGPQHQAPIGQHFGQQPIRSPAQVQYMPAQPKGPDFAYGPPQPGFSQMAPVGYQEQYHPGVPQVGGLSLRRPEPAPVQAYQPSGPRKTYITDVPPGLVPYHAGPAVPPKGGAHMAHPEDELERLTKKMLFDMDNPPSEEYFGRCASCGENVVGEGTGCTAMDQVFHVDCFVCMTCSTKLRGKPFYAVEKKAYCEPCYINTLETCTICSKPIMERILRATGKAYHPHCFTCVVCHRSLDGIPFTVDASNHIHCIEDFHKKFAPRCCVCSEPIMPAPGQEETVRIVALDRDFHVQCYRCEDCGSLLSEGDNQGCYPLDGHVLCKNCNTSRIQDLTAKATTDL
ncbi:lipoma-preferred partner isoform X1 [Cyclopterus lumpus]|uniref:LIM domain containing preferred translocation partner in lipoma n=2 Tax=Cyclopterus lumpus TaxID=8103 RepID=A0A8C2X481_CYCLU|nr:lipoma-preferred partner isoform X1 [Cyclopterus lumpus]XP_034385938.1 lipoma-preferred partner isoform X1 [Cyclopterus lumpus]XP_034385939.1 lipoma-preferred partner isoform X1 [Cyclopterus lumpus]XP_034385940.1 lipoma-preferred partner isoform X1 [Cyclopterus lumpus]XP_034385941.1 lipoma-preferred partner isoform X1 [Cyclopterus lumpus]XP_034385942.1 lipoma-preferred partner isoform X1 [Cyclopterus lumpus]XP_034385943.1 lipoma-preferred partner isoform X1 [Cyclopterus lumpus]XP_03438594